MTDKASTASAAEPPLEVVEAMHETAAQAERADGPPPWLDRFVWSVLWKVVAVGVVVALGVFAFAHLSDLLGMLAIALFFALAMIPGVEALVKRFGMRRGAAVGIIYLAAAVIGVLMIAVLIPGIVQFSEAVAASAAGWFDSLNEWSSATFGGPLVTDAAAEGTANAAGHIEGWAENVLGLLGSGISLLFDVITIAAFSFYFAAGFPGLMRAFMKRMPPARQRVFKWVAVTSIEQTGGYFYSRLLIMAINGGLGFVVMAAVGLDLVYAAPLALFMGFVSTFIPFIGTYLGATVPILITLAVEGLANALVLLAWVLVYQQIENYVLSPRLSSKTMELNGAVAFGGALAGGALAGPMGAFMALPIAALITAVIKNTGRTWAVIEDEDESALADPAPDA